MRLGTVNRHYYRCSTHQSNRLCADCESQEAQVQLQACESTLMRTPLSPTSNAVSQQKIEDVISRYVRTHIEVVPVSARICRSSVTAGRL